MFGMEEEKPHFILEEAESTSKLYAQIETIRKKIEANTQEAHQLIKDIKDETKDLNTKMSQLDPAIDHFTRPRYYTEEAQLARDAADDEICNSWLQKKEAASREHTSIVDHGTYIDLTDTQNRNPEWAAYHQESAEYYRKNVKNILFHSTTSIA